MNRISRRNFLKAAGVGAAALGLAACGGSSSSTASSVASSAAASSAVAADVTIKVAAIETGYGAEMWKKVAEAFTAQTGIKVDLTTDKKLEDVIGPSMQGGDYPDVVHLATGREAALTCPRCAHCCAWLRRSAGRHRTPAVRQGWQRAARLSAAGKQPWPPRMQQKRRRRKS